MKCGIGYLPLSWLRAAVALLAIAFSLGLAIQAGAAEGVRSKLDAGEIIVSCQSVPGSSTEKAEMTAIIKAPPEVVWQVITDINKFKDFSSIGIRQPEDRHE